MKYSYNNFYAGINKQPRIGDESHSFIANVEVEVPTGGYSVILAKDHVHEKTIYLRVHITPPLGLASQAFTTLTAHYKEPLAQEYEKAVLVGVVDENNVEVTH